MIDGRKYWGSAQIPTLILAISPLFQRTGRDFMDIAIEGDSHGTYVRNTGWVKIQ